MDLASQTLVPSPLLCSLEFWEQLFFVIGHELFAATSGRQRHRDDEADDWRRGELDDPIWKAPWAVASCAMDKECKCIRYRYRYRQTRRWSLEEEDEEGALAYAGPIREAAPTVVGTDAVVAHCSISSNSSSSTS